MKLIFLLSFQLLVVAVLAAATNEEDTVSLISNLLAKIKKLESNAVVASSSRKARQEDSPCSNNDNSCPTSVLNGVVTYVRWGNDTCPPTASTLYSGVVGGSCMNMLELQLIHCVCHMIHNTSSTNLAIKDMHICMELNIKLLAHLIKANSVTFLVLFVKLMDALAN